MPYYYGYGYGSDYYYTYLIYVLPALLISLLAQILVKSAFSKYSKVSSTRTGEQAAKKVLEANGVYNVNIVRVSGSMTDHFDPKTNTIRLSDTVFSVSSVAAVGVAAHEAGHAVQYAKGYKPIKWRAAILPVAQIGSTLSFPLLLIGIILSIPMLIDLGIVFFSAALLFQIVTLPVEFNASRRAIRTIEETNLLSCEQQSGAKKVLRAAALTYVASVLTSLLQLLRLLALSGRRR